MAEGEPEEEPVVAFQAESWVPEEPAMPQMPARCGEIPLQRMPAGRAAHAAEAPALRVAPRPAQELRQGAKVLASTPPLRVRIWRHFKLMCKKGVIIQILGIPLRHLMALHGLRLLVTGCVGWRTVLLALLLWPFSGLGVTAGAHRLWTHQSYHASPLMQCLLVLMFSTADQGSIQGWSLTHVMHHAYSDTPSDPHNRVAGFLHSHFLWIFSSRSFSISNVDYNRVVSGLGPIVRLHDSVSLLWDPLCSLGLPALIAGCWGEAAHGFYVAGALRWMCVQHITFFVNSVAHGHQEKGDPRAFDASAAGVGPRVSLLVTGLALGEGWHDYHHLFPWDYAAAELGAWDQWNPTKVFIDVCAACGLASDRRRCSDQLQTARRRQLAGAADDVRYVVDGPPFLRSRVPIDVTIEGSLHQGSEDLRAFRKAQ